MKRYVQYAVWIFVLISLIAIGQIIFNQQNELFKPETIIEPTPVNYWEIFEGISLKRTFIEEADAYYRIPVFTDELLALSGQEVTLSGYYLPYSRLDSMIIISRFPNVSCFFCGQAGIESVAMVELGNKNPHYRTDQKLIVKGKLMLNSTNINKLAFVITDALLEEE